MSGGFAALPLLLSLVGLDSVMSFVVMQRTREIGIRLPLRDAFVMLGCGIAAGLPAM